MNCRHCTTPLVHTFLDLGHAPPSNAYLSVQDLMRPETYYPLKVKVCDTCWLVQTEDYAAADVLFTPEYAYFSSTSKTWLAHAESYTRKVIAELELGKQSLVIEVASNDGYLLKNFVAAGIPCLGIEPTASTAAAAEKLGIPVLRDFFGDPLGKRLAVASSRPPVCVCSTLKNSPPTVAACGSLAAMLTIPAKPYPLSQVFCRRRPIAAFNAWKPI